MNAAGRQSNGIIKISDEVIAVCAANATLKTKGVADLAGGISNALSKNFLGKELTWKGIKVSQSEDGVELDVHIIVKYHAKVKIEVQEMTELKVTAVNIHVEGVEIPAEETETNDEK